MFTSSDNPRSTVAGIAIVIRSHVACRAVNASPAGLMLTWKIEAVLPLLARSHGTAASFITKTSRRLACDVEDVGLLLGIKQLFPLRQ